MILTTDFGGRLGNILLSIYTVFKYAQLHNISTSDIYFNFDYEGGTGNQPEKFNPNHPKNYLDQNKELFRNIICKFKSKKFFSEHKFTVLRNNEYIKNCNINLKRYNWLFPKTKNDRNLFRSLFYNNELFNNLKSSYSHYCNKYALHIRRGDFEVYKNGKYLETKDQIISKLNSALSKDQHAQFIVFSNDIYWCKDNINDKQYRIEFHNELLPYQDLILISLCKDIICNPQCSYTYCAKLLSTNIKTIPTYNQK